MSLPAFAEEREALALARRLRRGDAAAEEELVYRYSRSIVAILRRITRDAALADDLHQETFRAVLQRLRDNDLRDARLLGAYVHRTARNLALAERRRSARRLGWHKALEHVAAPLDDPLTSLLRGERSECVRDALGRLRRSRDRELLLRLYVAGDDRETIRRDLGVTSIHFNRLLFRARQRLGRAIEEIDDEVR